MKTSESRKMIINSDTMKCMGYFEEEDAERIAEKYRGIYDCVCFDQDGDIVVSNNMKE